MIRALRGREISAVELIEMHIRRIERLDGRLNSVILRRFEDAIDEAELADSARAAGEDSPLLGLPITVKECIDLIGTPSTAGLEFRRSHRAERDAPTVSRLRTAGAIVLGKTNVCPWLADLIADNPVYGRTNNPFDLTRTPGGSSGGSAALAAGLSALDLGSDLGGSIRIPAAFCGLFGHKPSEGAVPNSGHFPGSSLPNAGWFMAAQGPMARSADDLVLAMEVLLGPDVGLDSGWRIKLPPPRRRTLAEFRVAILPELPWLPVDNEIIAAMDQLVVRLRKLGAKVETISPPGLGDLREFYRRMRRFMSALVSSRWTDEHRRAIIADCAARDEFSHSADVEGFTATAGQYLQWHEEREQYRHGLRDFFCNYDVLLTPSSLTPAFKHPNQPVEDRIMPINERAIGFDYLTFYPGVASFPGHGATAFPIGRNRDGLPLGAQAISPFLEDWTGIRFAQLVEREIGGHSVPTGY